MTEPRKNPILDYARPGDRPRKKARHILALTYAAVAIPLGLLFLTATVVRFTIAARENIASERLYERHIAFRLLGCSTLLLVSGVWYARAGLRNK